MSRGAIHSAYVSQVASAGLARDRHQEQVVGKLDELCTRLIGNPAVIWFEFRDLCEGPRSQNDYIELARTCHTLIVAHLPVFDAAHENAARRFIALVDELYDHNVNLVISAAAPPDALYRGEKLKFEFRRTSSRLVEMQTEEYLARAHKP